MRCEMAPLTAALDQLSAANAALAEAAERLDEQSVEIWRLRRILERIVKRNPDGTVAIRLTEDALNAAAEYMPPNDQHNRTPRSGDPG